MDQKTMSDDRELQTQVNACKQIINHEFIVLEIPWHFPKNHLHMESKIK